MSSKKDKKKKLQVELSENLTNEILPLVEQPKNLAENHPISKLAEALNVYNEANDIHCREENCPQYKGVKRELKVFRLWFLGTLVFLVGLSTFGYLKLLEHKTKDFYPLKDRVAEEEKISGICFEKLKTETHNYITNDTKENGRIEKRVDELIKKVHNLELQIEKLKKK